MLASLSQDQYRFLLSNLVGFSLALPYKYIPKQFRNELNYLPGIFMIYYCFQRQANLLILFSAVSYLVCRYTSRRHVQYVTLLTSLVFLSYAHLSRQIIDYGGYVLDISGPFMIAVQKMTSLGFCIHDGSKKTSNLRSMEDSETDDKVVTKSPRKKLQDNQEMVSPKNGDQDKSPDGKDNNYDDDDDKSIRTPESPRLVNDKVSIYRGEERTADRERRLTAEQEKAAVDIPSFNEFMGYFFHFPSVLCGPIMYFKDYSDFVSAPENAKIPPGRKRAVARKLTISVSCALLHLTLNQKFEAGFLRSQEFLVHTPLTIRFYYLFIFTFLARLKYYVAWHLGEAISNMSGLGFNGYDAEGRPRWDLISNMDIFKFETSLNMREAIHSWNKTTQSWLRRTAYERAPKKLSVLSTYLLSAVWHGFYPGYYMTFLGGALFTNAARDGRRLVRPLFQHGTILPKVYDIITFILTRLTIAYVAFPFVILDFQHNYEIYKSLYFSIHYLAIFGIIIGQIFRAWK